MLEFENFERKSKWKTIFNNLDLYYPEIADDIQSWYTSGDWEITLKLKDGRKWIFDGRDNVLIRIRDDDIAQEEYVQEFSRRLNRKMRDAGIGTDELGERLGVSRATVSRYLNGHTIPSGYVIMRIAQILQCSTNELFDIWERR